METYNECLVYLITLHMMLFTDYVDRSLHEPMGYSMIVFVLLYLGSNALIVLSSAIWGLILVGKKYWNRFNGRNSKATVMPELEEEKEEIP